MSEVKRIGKFEVPVAGQPSAEVTVFAPEGAAGLPVILFIHGGGWCFGRSTDVEEYVKVLAGHGYVVANADYALAPDYTFPVATVQLGAALDFVRGRASEWGGDGDRLFVGGNSAGSHLASQVGALVSNRAFAEAVGFVPATPASAVRGLILINGVYDFDDADQCGFPDFDHFMKCFTGCDDYKSCPSLDLISTQKQVAPGFPAAFVTAGDIDPLEPQSRKFADYLNARGCDCVGYFHTGTARGLDHDYVFDLSTAYAREAFDLIIDFMKKRA